MLDLDDELYTDDETDTTLSLDALRKTFLASEWANRTIWRAEYPVETHVAGVSVRGRIDAVFRQFKGVSASVCGYAGGTVPNPDYRSVCSGATGHHAVARADCDALASPRQVSPPEQTSSGEDTLLMIQSWRECEVVD